jgi:hypothetical protein
MDNEFVYDESIDRTIDNVKDHWYDVICRSDYHSTIRKLNKITQAEKEFLHS